MSLKHNVTESTGKMSYDCIVRIFGGKWFIVALVRGSFCRKSVAHCA